MHNNLNMRAIMLDKRERELANQIADYDTARKGYYVEQDSFRDKKQTLYNILMEAVKVYIPLPSYIHSTPSSFTIHHLLSSLIYPFAPTSSPFIQLLSHLIYPTTLTHFLKPQESQLTSTSTDTIHHSQGLENHENGIRTADHVFREILLTIDNYGADASEATRSKIVDTLNETVLVTLGMNMSVESTLGKLRALL